MYNKNYNIFHLQIFEEDEIRTAFGSDPDFSRGSDRDTEGSDRSHSIRNPAL